MKVVADYPAYQIIDMEQDVLDWPEDTKINMAIAYESRQYGTMYRMYYISGVAAYVRKSNNESPEEYHSDPGAAVTRAKSMGQALYWVSECSTSITAWNRPKETHILGKVWQKIRFDGKLFELVHNRAEFYSLKEISE